MIGGLLARAFTLGGLLRNGWFMFGLLAALGGLTGGAYLMGKNSADNACEAAKAASQAAAAHRSSRASAQIANIRVEGERRRAQYSEEFNNANDEIGNSEILQAELVAAGCELDPVLLRVLNGAIQRTGGPD